jgi:hypothetical protein
MWQDYTHPTSASDFLLSNLGFKNNYILKISKSVQFILLIQIPNFGGSFHSVQYDESIHAPDFRIRFIILKRTADSEFRN